MPKSTTQFFCTFRTLGNLALITYISEHGTCSPDFQTHPELYLFSFDIEVITSSHPFFLTWTWPGLLLQAAKAWLPLHSLGRIINMFQIYLPYWPLSCSTQTSMFSVPAHDHARSHDKINFQCQCLSVSTGHPEVIFLSQKSTFCFF
jgi:hypothetical protein